MKTTLDSIQAKTKIDAIITEIEKVIIGKHQACELTVAAFLANGHVLFEDIPGTGKTMLVKAFSKTVQGEFNRIQFTPDLLPSDILGVSLYNMQQQAFEFKPGPLFTDILLADEINRTTPKTQSALLEAMSERQVTIDGVTRPLNEHFFVLATQNPIDYEGTYPLPEAQLDRFLIKISLGYPTLDEELSLVSKEDREITLKTLVPQVTREEITALKASVEQIYISPELLNYAMQLVHQSREHAAVRLGISPRGAISFIRMARSLALCRGRDFCIPDDFIDLLKPVFSHRILLKSRQNVDSLEMDRVLYELKSSLTVPTVTHD